MNKSTFENVLLVVAVVVLLLMLWFQPFKAPEVLVYEDPRLPVVCWRTSSAITCLPKWALVAPPE